MNVKPSQIGHLTVKADEISDTLERIDILAREFSLKKGDSWRKQRDSDQGKMFGYEIHFSSYLGRSGDQATPAVIVHNLEKADLVRIEVYVDGFKTPAELHRFAERLDMNLGAIDWVAE